MIHANDDWLALRKKPVIAQAAGFSYWPIIFSVVNRRRYKQFKRGETMAAKSSDSNASEQKTGKKIEQGHLKISESNASQFLPFGPQINFRQKPYRNDGPSFRLAQFGSSFGHQKTSRGR